MQVNGREGLVQGEHPRDDHEHGAHERAGGSVDMDARDLAKSDEKVGYKEDGERGDHGEECTTKREWVSSGRLRLYLPAAAGPRAGRAGVLSDRPIFRPEILSRRSDHAARATRCFLLQGKRMTAKSP